MRRERADAPEARSYDFPSSMMSRLCSDARAHAVSAAAPAAVPSTRFHCPTPVGVPRKGFVPRSSPSPGFNVSEFPSGIANDDAFAHGTLRRTALFVRGPPRFRCPHPGRSRTATHRTGADTANILPSQRPPDCDDRVDVRFCYVPSWR